MTTYDGFDSAYPPNAAQAQVAYAGGARVWAGYVGGKGAYHVWQPTDWDVIKSAGFDKVVPIWVPTYALAGDPRTEYDQAVSAMAAAGLYGPPCLDTEARERVNSRVGPFVDEWLALGGTVYGGGVSRSTYLERRGMWWVVAHGDRSLVPGAGQAWQVGATVIDGLDVDSDIFDAAFPFATFEQRLGDGYLTVPAGQPYTHIGNAGELSADNAAHAEVFYQPAPGVFQPVTGAVLGSGTPLFIKEVVGNTAPASEPKAQSYTIVSGDTLSSIAQAHGVTLEALLAANPSITNPNLIYRGQVVTTP